MKHYTTEPFMDNNVSFGIPDEFRDIELEAMLVEVKESDEFQGFSVGIGGSIYRHCEIWNSRIYFGCCDKNLYCLGMDGRMLWSFKTGDVTPSVTVHGGVAYAVSFDGNLYAVDAMSGKLVWKFPTDGKILYAPFIHGDVLYFGSEDGNLYAVGTDSRPLWKFRTRGPIACRPFAQGDRVYFGSMDCNLYCVDKRDGSLIWKFSGSDEVGSPVVYRESQ